VGLRTDVFESRELWHDYAVTALQTVERLADELGLADRRHLWPDKSLGNVGMANRIAETERLSALAEKIVVACQPVAWL